MRPSPRRFLPDLAARRAACPVLGGGTLDRRLLSTHVLVVVLGAMLLKLASMPMDAFEHATLAVTCALVVGLLAVTALTRAPLQVLHGLLLAVAWSYVLSQLWHVLFRVPEQGQLQALGTLGPWAAVTLASHLWMLGRRDSLPLSVLALGSTAALLAAYVLQVPGAAQQPVVGATLQLLLAGAVMLVGQHTTARRVTADLRRDLLGDGQAERDALTGLPGNAAMKRWLDGAVARRPEGLGVVVIALDAPVPGAGGPGDARRLAHVARVLQGALRDEDMLGYLSDDQLVLALRAADARSARALCERLRLRVASRPVDGHNVTVTMGLAFYDDHRSGLSLLREAEDTCLSLQREGSNRVALGPLPAHDEQPTSDLRVQPSPA
ncbi:GGDEF domain-containing protein [Deinococcus multiflagellatus]|uniref:GGDEF domain-containing protein n=1 Tax=Deinococcus multiflagellatus TaxID=1656887 RepID=A0ABW1ZN40_9DEIO|nr:diguanylate cyclase [Deinococcus multiflagellatus]MBZ9715180.1 diguanylate cyclase [Deinococcus multiflagellatus]